jgi:hypothetical protein
LATWVVQPRRSRWRNVLYGRRNWGCRGAGMLLVAA